MHLIRRSKAPTFEEALKESLRQIKGGFTFAILTKDALYGAVDPNAIRPLVVGKMQDDTYILASETCAIDVLGLNTCKISMLENMLLLIMKVLK